MDCIFHIEWHYTYSSGATVPITGIGVRSNGEDAGSSLVCVTSYVNTVCCRSSDGWNVDFPNGSIIPGVNRNGDFTRNMVPLIKYV